FSSPLARAFLLRRSNETSSKGALPCFSPGRCLIFPDVSHHPSSSKEKSNDNEKRSPKRAELVLVSPRRLCRSCKNRHKRGESRHSCATASVEQDGSTDDRGERTCPYPSWRSSRRSESASRRIRTRHGSCRRSCSRPWPTARCRRTSVVHSPAAKEEHSRS